VGRAFSAPKREELQVATQSIEQAIDLIGRMIGEE
jgi:hypothetical protein